MIFQDCYAEYDAKTGRLSVGNDVIEKTLRLYGGSIATESVTEKTSGKCWRGETRLQRCPVLERTEVPTVVFSVRAVTDSVFMQPHLLAELELVGRGGTVWYTYLVFPGVPFVYTQAFVEKHGDTAESERGSRTEVCSGIESEYADSEADLCDGDTLDCIPLGNTHLEAEIITLTDQTDRNDVLVRRQTVPVYGKGRLETEGNIFRISDYVNGHSLLLVRHAPTPACALHRTGPDLLIRNNRYALLRGTGIDFSQLPPERIPYYACAVGAAKTEDLMEAFWRYSTAFSAGDPGRELFIMSNTWGDRSQDLAVCEDFILREIACGQRLGVDIVQIDDGWQTGITANSLRRQGGVWEGYYAYDANFWTANPERFPNGLRPLAEAARAAGMELGLWFSPDSSGEFANYQRDIETILSLYRDYGIRYFKLDAIKIRSKLCEKRLIRIFEELTARSGGQIRLNLDITAERRFGYLYQPQYGTLFVENRYTDWGNYYPHNTFRNLWQLCGVLPARRLQMELLNKNRNPQAYTGMPFAPMEYGMDYLFASVLPSNPLVWMEVSHLPESDAELLSRVIRVYKQYSGELFAARVYPIGDEPNGMRFSGYFCRNADGRSGHILLFREQTRENSYSFRLPVRPEWERTRVLYQSAPVKLAPEGQAVRAEFAAVRSFVWLRCGPEE